METINYLRKRLINMSKEATRLNDAFTELDSHIDKEAEYILRQEEASKIDVLKSRLVSEINRIKGEEDIAERCFNTSKRFNSIAGFALGGIVGAITKQNPLLSGYRSYSTELDKKAEFGNVMIAAKENGEFEDTKVIAVSRLAREDDTTEPNIITSIKRDGYLLFTPEEFWQLLDRLKEEIMEGKKC